jgi:hypothetical protein
MEQPQSETSQQAPMLRPAQPASVFAEIAAMLLPARI